MSMAEKLTTIAENEQKVYEAGQKSEYDRFWDEHQKNGKRTIYAGAFAGWKGENFKPKYKITPSGATVAQYMFYAFNRNQTGDEDQEMFDMSPYQHMLDFSKITNQAGMFADANIKNLYCDFSSCKSLNTAFQGINVSNLENITLKVTSTTTSFTSWFSNRRNITQLFFTDDSEITASVPFGDCSKLTYESIQSIKNALGVVTSAKTLTLHADAKAKLSESDIAEITQKGWTLA